MVILNKNSVINSRHLVYGLVSVTLVSLFIGRYQILEDLNRFRLDSLFWPLLFNVRLPRVLLALLAGAGLALSGLVTQMIFRNPLADSGILGISQSAGFGAALGILAFGNSFVFVQSLSFLFSLVALAMTLVLSSEIGKDKILSLVLAGIAVSALFSSGLGLLKYLADPVNQLPNIVFWLLGSLSTANWMLLMRTAILVIPLMVLFFVYRWRLNIHALDKSVSFSLGIKDTKEIYIVLIGSVLLTSTIISVSGIINWVGLIIPNFARVIFGSDSSISLTNSLLMGGIFMVVCDTLSRSLLPGEIPLGIFTALIGSMLFVFLLLRKKLTI